MKTAETKKEFVRLRAEGNSYGAIAGQLHISKSTCTKWERELEDQIDELKRAELAELCEGYGMAKKSRIKRLGDTLAKIEAALDAADFGSVDPAKLLDYKLKYTEALKGEYTGKTAAAKVDGTDAKAIVNALGNLLDRVRAGEVTTEQAQKESAILSQLLKAYDTIEVKNRLDELEMLLGGRQ